MVHSIKAAYRAMPLEDASASTADSCVSAPHSMAPSPAEGAGSAEGPEQRLSAAGGAGGDATAPAPLADASLNQPISTLLAEHAASHVPVMDQSVPTTKPVASMVLQRRPCQAAGGGDEARLGNDHNGVSCRSPAADQGLQSVSCAHRGACTPWNSPAPSTSAVSSLVATEQPRASRGTHRRRGMHAKANPQRSATDRQQMLLSSWLVSVGPGKACSLPKQAAPAPPQSPSASCCPPPSIPHRRECSAAGAPLRGEDACSPCLRPVQAPLDLGCNGAGGQQQQPSHPGSPSSLNHSSPNSFHLEKLHQAAQEPGKDCVAAAPALQHPSLSSSWQDCKTASTTAEAASSLGKPKQQHRSGLLGSHRRHGRKAMLRVDESQPCDATCGVRVVWVSADARRTGIASKLLDAARYVAHPAFIGQYLAAWQH